MKHILGLAICVLLVAGCVSTTRKTTRWDDSNPSSETLTQTLEIDGQLIQQRRAEWQKEYLVESGEAPVVSKYDDVERNKRLARKGALLDAQRNMARKISETRISETTSMADFETSDYVKSQIEASLRDVEVINEQYNEKTKSYEVKIRMPKVKILDIIEEEKHFK